MRIVIIGATGYVGGALLQEALQRGHAVTAVVRDTGKLPSNPRLTPVRADASDAAALSAVLAGHDAVLSAFSPDKADPALREHHVTGVRAILDATRRARVVRLLVVGGAGSLEVAPGVQLVDTPEFPALWKATALATRDVLELLRAERELDWTFLSPPAQLVPGERTGRYRTGGDALLADASGASRITLADYAVAMIDELERPRHARRRFTVAA